MVEIPEKLARSIRAGQCVLWTGAGVGSLADRPGWAKLLTETTRSDEGSLREGLDALIERGDLRVVLDHARHSHADDLRERLGANGSVDLGDAAGKLGKLPWAGCIATAYPDVVGRLVSDTDDGATILGPDELAGRGLGQGDRFVVHVPVADTSWLQHAQLSDLLADAARCRTNFLLGFSVGDPDLQQVLETLSAAGRGGDRFAVIDGMSEPQRRQVRQRYGVEVIDDGDLASVVAALVEAGTGDADDDAVARAEARLDLVRALEGVPTRADLGDEASLGCDPERIIALRDRLPAEDVPASVQLQVGTVLLARGKTDAAKKSFEAAAGDEEAEAFAQLGLAWVAAASGDGKGAAEALTALAKSHPELSWVDDDTTLQQVVVRDGAAVVFRATQGDATVDLDVVTLPRALGSTERKALDNLLAKLPGLDFDPLGKVTRGQVQGRRLTVVRQAAEGSTLSDTIASGGRMSLERTMDVIRPLTEALTAAHDAGVLHGGISGQRVIVTADGPVLTGFGPASALGRWVTAAMTAEGVVAPEVLAGGNATAKADAYAVAALTYRCLAGVPAVVGAAPSAFAVDLDPRVDAALAKSMHPDPSQRASVRDLETALVDVVRSPVVRAVEEAIPSGQIAVPQDKDDIEAWAWVLDRKPAHAEARANIDRIEKEARDGAAWDRVAEVLAVKAQHAQVLQDRVALLRELVTVFEHRLSAPANAFETAQSLIEEVSVAEQIGLAEELERLAEVTGKWGPLADSLMVVAERVSDPKDQGRLYERLASVFSERLGATDRAIAAYEKAVEVAPHAESLEALAGLYRKAVRPAEYATALLSLAELQEGTAKAVTLRTAAKVLHEELGDEEGAFATLQVVLETDANDTEALQRAEGLARQLEDHEALFDLLSRRASVALDAAEIRELRHEAAKLALGELKAPDKAIAQYEALLNDDRSDRPAATELVELLRARVADEPGRRSSLIDALGVLVDLVETPDARVALLAESAELLDQEVDGKAAAADNRERILAEVGIERPEAQAAAESLEKWYRRQDDFDALIALLAKLGGAQDAPLSARVDAWAKALELRATGPHADEEAAIEVLEALSKLQPDSTKWRDDLLARYLQKEDYDKAGPLIRAQVFAEDDPKRKAALFLKGGLLREQIGKPELAIEALEEAVKLDDSLYEAWLGLRDLYRTQEQPLKAIEAQVAAAKAHPNRPERVRLTFEAAQTYLDELDKSDKGLDLLEQVVALDPDHREATGLLVERLVAAGDLSRAWPQAQTYVMQVRSQAADDKLLNLRALSIAGRCALKVDEKDRAREYLEKARGFDATNLDVLQLLADLDMDAESYSDALRNYQSVILGVGSKMPPSELSQLYVKMADCRIGMGEKPKAVQMAERALEINADDETAIDRLIELAPAVGGPAAEVKANQRLAELLARREARLADNDAQAAEAARARRIEVLQAIATLQVEQLKAPIEAVGTLEKLLELQPGDPAVLHQMLDVLTAAERWRDATNVLDRLAEAQSNGAIKAKYLYAGGAILREQVGDAQAALAWMRRVLEADPANAKAYQAAAELLEAAKDHKELARLHRTRLKTLPADADAKTRMALLNKLGELYETKLGDPKTAVAAYNEALKLATSEMKGGGDLREQRGRVMRLAVQLGDDEIDKAIAQGHALVVDDPTDFETYHRLVELYLNRGAKDRARALARTLVFVKQADEAEEELAKETGGGSTTARGRISREMWRKRIYHPFQNKRITDILSLIWPVVAGREGHTHQHHGVTAADKVDVSLQSPEAFARYVAHACQVLESPQPQLLKRETSNTEFVVDALSVGEGNSRKVVTALMAGKVALSETNEVVLRFRAGRAMARARPEHILGRVLPSANAIRNAVYGAVAVSVPGAKLPTDVESDAAKYAELFRTYLQPAMIDQLGVICGKLVAKGDIDTKRWLQGAAFTVTRAGFILSDSLETAARIVTQEGDASIAVPYKDRLRDLIAYSVSDPYMRVRKELGFGR
jgi:tetratricopeptide (TPR) repeat protein